ncbi:DUF7146 domain-containing protein [Asticcacaulis excentricus]|uniref:DUF7146 domain-containing protein n=1 Tax=Asticcacaulis excentricus (strain ATCC 15261 / DSM 4724 / KCTC 12464 / NCIMB 9791 / VKM B-1370 / CB 48) TaxID=573065 RepID=E8RPP4_ASTEC|nr:hypothetical protein [Asticcacaulis excentricus]ADU12021.1 hypothetical protein Astex_0323 [Asticcacaulis excentricus CB 48]
MMVEGRDLFAFAKELASIEEVAGVKLVGGGVKRRGPCPLCGQGQKKKSSYAFEVNVRKKTFNCYVCNAHGDVIELERLINGVAGEPTIAAAKRLVGDVPADYKPKPKVFTVIPDEPSSAAIYARELRGDLRTAAGTLVQRYLMSRGLSGRVLLTAVKHLYFHPAVYFSGPKHNPVTFPAMIALVVVPADDGKPKWTGGIHVTYLSRDGYGKAIVPEGKSAKRMMGPQSLNGRPGGAWLIPPSEMPEASDLVVAEGIESALSMAVLHGGMTLVVAALSLNRLQGQLQPDKYGRVNPDMPEGVPGSAFTWPSQGWTRVFIGCDADMSPMPVKIRNPLKGGTTTRILTGIERARVCGSLAAAAWRQTGVQADPVAPSAGMDFNDLLRERQGI